MEIYLFGFVIFVIPVVAPFLFKMLDEKNNMGFIQHKTAKIITLIVSPIVFCLVYTTIYTLLLMSGNISVTSGSLSEILLIFVILGGIYVCVFFSVRALFEKWNRDDDIPLRMLKKS